MNLICSITLIVVSALIGHYFGKSTLDSMVDSNLKKVAKNLIIVLALLSMGVVLAILQNTMRFSFVVAVLILILSFVFGLFFYIVHANRYGLKTKWNEQVGKIIPNLSYDDTREETRYDLYLPAQKKEEDSNALVLYIHGGSFSAGNRLEGSRWCQYMTARGYVSATMDYSLLGKEKPSNLHLMTNQVKQCVDAIKEEAHKFGYNLTEMALTGGSAGGTLSLLYAYSKASESSIPIRFVFEQAGPAYFHPLWWGGFKNPEAQKSFLTSFSGIEVTDEMLMDNSYLEIVNAISPVSYINEQTVPTLCAYGTEDKMVPTCLKFPMFERLEKNKVPYDFVEFKHSNHGMYDDISSKKEFLKKLDEYCEKYFQTR